MEQTSVPLTPLQHQQRLGKLVIPLLFIVNSGLDAIGETQLAEISQRHIQTCRVQLRRLASLGYLERRTRYHGYVLKRQALEVIPTRILDQAGLCLLDLEHRSARQRELGTHSSFRGRCSLAQLPILCHRRWLAR